MTIWLKKAWCWLGFSHCTLTSRSLETWKDPKDPFGVLTYAHCRWCGAKGQIDSQGNLF